MINQFFEINEPVIFFIYGLAFFTLGLSVVLQSRKYSQLEIARYLPWLAVFGMTHGLTEWGYLFIPIQARYLPSSVVQVLNLVQLFLMSVSFVALFQFGLSLTVPDTYDQRWRWVPTLAMTVLWLVVLSINNMVEPFSLAHLRITGEIWVRVLLGFPGSLLSGVGFLRQSRRVRDMALPRIATYMSRVAYLFFAYALLSGLITPPHDILWTRWLHDQIFSSTLGFPVPLLRSIIGMGLTYFIRLSQEVFVVETDRRLEAAERQKYEIADRDRTILNAVALTVTRPLGMQEMLRDALICVLEELGIPAGWITMPDSEGRMHIVCQLHIPEPVLSCNGGVEGCLCHYVMETREVSPPLETYFCPPMSTLEIDGMPLQHGVSVPLVARDNSLGVLNLMNSKGQPFDEGDWGLLKAIGRQIGVAIENISLYEEIRKKDALRGRLLDKIITAQEEERRRVARDLHDQLGQELSGLSMTIGAAATALPADPERAVTILEDASEIATSMMGTLRSIILDLRPAALDDLGLVQALRRYSNHISRRAGLKISVIAEGLQGRLPPQLETVVFRILQEAIMNVALHAKASRVEISLRRVDSRLHVTVSDDGQGFVPSSVLPSDESGRGWGLLGMQERAALFDGAVEIKSAPGAGTTIVVDLPLGTKESSS